MAEKSGMGVTSIGRGFAVIAVAACFGLGAESAMGTPMVTKTENTNSTTAYTVSSTDLINGLSPATGSSLGTWKGSEQTNADPAILTNGAYGVAGGGTN